MKSPVGEYWTELRRSGWFQTLGFGEVYQLAGRRSIHTGIDLVRGDRNHIGAPVYAAENGVVIYARRVPNSTWGNLVVIKHNNVRYTRYAHLQRIQVREKQTVKAGELIGTLGDSGMPGLPHLHFDIGISSIFEKNPTYWAWDDETAVRKHFADPNNIVLAVDRSKPPVPRRVNVGQNSFLNIRAEPSLKAKIVGRLSHGTLINIYPSDTPWVCLAGSFDQFVYQEYLEPVSKTPVFIAPEMRIGLNIDFRNPHGIPDNALSKQFGLVRFALKARQGTPTECATFYRPFIEALTNSGVQCLLVLTHETWGEGRGFDWNNMDTGRWQTFILGYAEYLRSLMRDLPRNADIFYQIGNEHDQASEASIKMPPQIYATFLDACLEILEDYGLGMRAVSQGHVAGRPSYWRDVTLASQKHEMLRAFAIHPYGISGASGDPYGGFGTVEQIYRGWRAVTRKPIWFTEFGVCNGTAKSQPPETVARYISSFLAASTACGVECAMWYGYSDHMHTCYGVVDNQMRIKQPVLGALLEWNKRKV